MKMNSEDPNSSYFPMGFVHGDPLLTYSAGYDFRQIPSEATGFVDGLGYSKPVAYQSACKLFHHSIAIPGESLSDRVHQCIKAGVSYFETAQYGRIPISLNQDGSFRTRPLDCFDLFDEQTVQYFHDFVREHVRVQSQGTSNDQILYWGLDNEWEGRASYSAVARSKFIDWLRKAYDTDIDMLNQCWNSKFSSFDCLLNTSLPEEEDALRFPGRFLDWWSFQSQHFTDFMVSLSRSAHEADPLKRGVIHKASQLTLEMPDWRERILNQEAFAQGVRPYSGGLFGVDMYGHGDRQAYELSYVYHCIDDPESDRVFGVMLCENNNHNGPANQFAATQWRLLANGLKGMMYFTTGYAGGVGDWDVFSFRDPKTGALKEKFFYAPRWANHVRRLECFWRTCRSRRDMPRIAMLLPRRDVLVSKVSDRNPDSTRYSYPQNHRWLVYRWLREQGYWVDVIPYGRLTADCLKSYQALCLIGAEHLSEEECNAVKKYVDKEGGVLLADSSVGYYNTHHFPAKGLEGFIGVSIVGEAEESSANYHIDSQEISAMGRLTVELNTATQIGYSGGTDIPVFHHRVGCGQVFYFPFKLGTLQTMSTGACLASVRSDAATAESEEYVAYEGEFVIGRWFASLLKTASVYPSYTCNNHQELYRVEQPQFDEHGNCVVVVSTRAQTQPFEILESGEIELTLPQSGWKSIWWSSAEDNSFFPITRVCSESGNIRIPLPKVTSAGVLYFFKDFQTALLSVEASSNEGHSIDGITARVRSEVEFQVNVALHAPAEPIGCGQLKLNVPCGWKVSPAVIRTKNLKTKESHKFSFTVIPCHDVRPDYLSQIECEWGGPGNLRSSAFVCVEHIVDSDEIQFLLSGNTSFPVSYPYRKMTGATYEYQTPENASLIADPVSQCAERIGSALTNGFSSVGGQRHSHHRDKIGIDHTAAYQCKKVDILFDLKSDYHVMRVVIVAGVADVYPEQVKVFVSSNEYDFIEVAELTLEHAQLEFETDTFRALGRFVRIQVSWPEVGGCLDEIEIWGR